MSRFVREQEDATPNLIPIMNLFTALIPFLLMSAAFFQISIIQISVPIPAGDSDTDIAAEDDKITLNMRITPAAFELSASSDTLAPDVLSGLKAAVPRPAGADKESERALYTQLTEAALQIKGNYTKSDTVVVVPDDNVAYEVVINAADAVRETSISRDGILSRIALFPRVVLSTMVK